MEQKPYKLMEKRALEYGNGSTKQFCEARTGSELWCDHQVEQVKPSWRRWN